MAATLVLSAWEPEIAPLRRLARAVDPARLALGTVGVGAVDAALGAAAAIAAARPTRVIFVGTAGAFPRGRATAAIGAVAIAGEVSLASTAALRGDGYLPEPLVTRAPISAALAAALAASGRGRKQTPDLPILGVACPIAVTRSATLGRQIARATGAALENLEAFAVARAAVAAGIEEVAAVLGIANRVGPRGHQEWRAHHDAASHAACRVVWGLVRR
jgi:nucleoside phosphorylase